MIYEQLEREVPASQGDILDDCPILYWEVPSDPPDAEPESVEGKVRAIVLTQACDLAQAKTTHVLVAVVHGVQRLVDRGVLQPKLIRDQIRAHRVYGWYFLPAGAAVEESVIDLRDLYTLPRILVERLVREGKRVARIRTPYREHLAQHFATTYARIGLPEPYPTQPDE